MQIYEDHLLLSVFPPSGPFLTFNGISSKYRCSLSLLSGPWRRDEKGEEDPDEERGENAICATPITSWL